jgi:photosystem II stability/assembly factor-like uncharacterized protein
MGSLRVCCLFAVLAGNLTVPRQIHAAPHAEWREIGHGLPMTAIGARTLIADPVSPSTLYAISSSGLLFKSTDGSNSWAALSGVTGVHSLLIDPQNAAILYAGTSHGVLKSTDGGATWTGANAGLPQGFPTWAQVLAIDPANSSVIYVWKWNGLFKSTDGGQNWNALNARFYPLQGVPATLPNLEIQKLVIDPAHSSTMYAGPGLFKSTDGGSTWYAVSIMGVTGYCCKLLALEPATSALYAAYSDLDRNGHIVKSADQGTTWTPADRGFPSSATADLVFDPNNAGTIYAPYVQLGWSGGPPTFGFVKSTDGGGTWMEVNTGIPGSYISSFAVDGSSALYMSYRDSNTGLGSIFKSADGGANWQAANAGPTIVDVLSLAIDSTNPGVIYALAGPDGVFKSADSGANWTALTALPIPRDPSGPIPGSARSLAIDSGDSNILYAWAPCHFFQSMDAGATWLSTRGLPPNACGNEGGFLSKDPHHSSTLYVAQSDIAEPGGWLLKTVDGGMSWDYVWQSSGFALALAIAPDDPATLYGGTSIGLLKTTDGGSNWSHTGPGPVVNALAIDPVNPNIVYAATMTDDFYPFPGGFAGLFKTTDGGTTWSATNSGLETLDNTGAPITVLAPDPDHPEVIYAGTSGNGVFRSTDGGAHWHIFNNGLENLDVHVLAISPGTPNQLFASTAGGLFAIPLFSGRVEGRNKE